MLALYRIVSKTKANVKKVLSLETFRFRGKVLKPSRPQQRPIFWHWVDDTSAYNTIDSAETKDFCCR